MRNESGQKFADSLRLEHFESRMDDGRTEKRRKPAGSPASADSTDGETQVWERSRPTESAARFFGERKFSYAAEREKGLLTPLGKEIFRDTPLQRQCLERVVAMEASLHGVSPPAVSYIDDHPGTSGWYDDETDQILFNIHRGANETMWDAVDTVVHETRHKYQDRLLEVSPKESVRTYLDYSVWSYPSDEELDTTRGKERYYDNGLELDSFHYAAGRMHCYAQYRAAEIAAMTRAPGSLIHNQILMQIGDVSSDGKSSPLIAGDVYESFTAYDEVSKEVYAMGRTGVDFSQEAIQEALAFYQSGVERIQQMSAGLVSNLKSSLEQHPYEELKRSVNVVVDYYNGELPQTIQAMIRSWAESGDSFSSLLKKMKESEESINAARRLEGNLIDSVSSTFQSIEPSNSRQAVRANPEQVMADAGFVQQYKKQLEGLAAEYKKACETRAQVNTLYENLKPMVASTWEAVVALFEAQSVDIVDLAQEFERTIGGNVGHETPTTIHKLDGAKVKQKRGTQNPGY